MDKKVLIVTILFSISCLGFSQESVNRESLFIRVYSLEGKKIANAHLINIDNNGLYLEKKDSLLQIPLAKIGKIKTKKSLGGNVLFGSIIGTTLGLALIVGDPETSTSSVFSGEERVVAVAGGMVIGAVVGLGTGLLKNSKVYLINGSNERLQQFKEVLQVSKDKDILTSTEE